MKKQRNQRIPCPPRIEPIQCRIMTCEVQVMPCVAPQQLNGVSTAQTQAG